MAERIQSKEGDIGAKSSPKCCCIPRWVCKCGIAFGVALALALGLGLGLGLKPPGNPLNIPELKPPVKASTPSGLNGQVSRQLLRQLQGLPSNITVIRDRFFTEGPTDFTYRLGMIDGRMKELKTRNNESPRKCVKNAPTLWSPPSLPGGRTFPMYFSCVEDMGEGSGLSVYFGVKDSIAYLMEVQKPPASSTSPTMAVLARAHTDSSYVDVIQVIQQSSTNNASSWMFVQANKTSQSLEFAVAAQTTGTGVGCGVKVHSMPTGSGVTIYAHGEFADHGAPNACTGFPGTTCVNGATLAGETCPSSGAVTTFSGIVAGTLTYSSLVAENGGSMAAGIISGTRPTGVTDFNE
jgi:hypothetical protein